MFHRSKKPGNPRIDVIKMSQPDLVEQFAEAFVKEYNLAQQGHELSKAMYSLASGKTSGSDGIPPDLIKHCKTTLLQPLHEILYQCWKERAVQQDMRDAKVVTLYKNKGERSNCNNYIGISKTVGVTLRKTSIESNSMGDLVSTIVTAIILVF